MFFKNRGSLRDRHLHGLKLAGPLVSRIANVNARVAAAKQVNLIQIQIRISGRIFADAVQDGYGPFAVAVEAHHTVDVLERLSRGGQDHGPRGRCYLLGQRPVGQAAARDLQVLEAMLDDLVDGSLIPWGADGYESMGDDRFLEAK